MHECPTCGDEFDTRRGLGVHHSHVHDERLPNRECDHCGSAFHSEYAKRYCSDACLDDAVSFEGEDNPNYRGGTETTSCEQCETEFEYYPSEKPGRYCPECVRTTQWQDPPVVTGEEHPRWNGGPVELECDWCGEAFERNPSAIESEEVFCSRDCRAEWLSDAFTGEGHPNWKGGGNIEYGPGWARTRRAALERDGYECVLCGTDREDLGRNPDVHHIRPVRSFAASPEHDVSDAHVLDNVVTLCPRCHRWAEFGKVDEVTLRGGMARGGG